MSQLAIEQDGQLVDAMEATAKVRQAIQDARADRKQYEPTWHSNLAFAAGKFWLEWHRSLRRLTMPEELQSKELYTADVVTEYRMTALGELASEDDRPELLLIREDATSEDFQEQLNKAVGWGWDHEWNGDDSLAELDRMVVDLGTAAMRPRWDPTYGPIVQESVPFVDGKPVLDEAEAVELFSGGPRDDVEMRPVRQGRHVWEPLSPFNLIVPPGIPHERDFPWECVVRPVLLDSVKAEYGEAAASLKEDADIGSLLGSDELGLASLTGVDGSEGKRGRLRDHVWLFTYYERPCPKYPDGRTIVFASNAYKPLRVENDLPYRTAGGVGTSGIAYFHWWRVTGRFWSRSLIEAMKDPQRNINKRRTQTNEIIDRGMPMIFVERNSQAKTRRGVANELIEIGPQERPPIPFEGIRPGEWLSKDVADSREDLERATGIRGPRLGENPANVTTYAQLALLTENDQVKRQQIHRERKLGIARLIEAAVHDIRAYWGSERQLALAGDDDSLEALTFNATKIPPFFVVKNARGAAKPRSQAAELKKVEELWQAALASGAVALDPQGWVEWFRDSLQAGQALDLPEGGQSYHADKAELENSLILQGQVPPVLYYDLHALHIPIHREQQIDADLAQDLELWSAFEEHIQAHVLKQQETAQIMAQMAVSNSPAEEEVPAEPEPEPV